jgi:hypothetical protein
MAVSRSSDSELEFLVSCAAAGDEVAWRSLWSRLQPRLTAFIHKRTFVARSHRPDDDGRDVLVAVMGKLRDHQHHRLKLYLATRQRDPALDFMRWVLVLARRVAIDTQRSHPNYVARRTRAAAASTPAAPAPRGRWIDHTDLPSDDCLSAGRPPLTNRLAACEILRRADELLSTAQRRALTLWAEDVRHEDIARALALAGPADAERLVRAALERLRRHYRKGN